MLRVLSIRDIVLIERLDLQFEAGLCVLTGETGAGKSILLDALGLALGQRADIGLVRAKAEQGSVVAEFELAADGPTTAVLRELELEADDGLILRRVIGADGRSRAFVNDRPVTVATLRRVGDSLAEIHGQHDDRGLLDAGSHRGLLDEFGGLDVVLERCRTAYATMRKAESILQEEETSLAEARATADYLAHVAGELEALAPEAGEEVHLTGERTRLRDAENLGAAVAQAESLMSGEGSIEPRLHQALRIIDRVTERAVEQLQPVRAALERVAIEYQEAMAALRQAERELQARPEELDRVEERLFALREAARKHRVSADQLPVLLLDVLSRLQRVEAGEERLENLRRQRDESRRAFATAAEALSAARKKAAAKLERQVKAELAPLALEKARFIVAVERLQDDSAGAGGLDRVIFRIATNDGVEPGDLNRVASGGELSRVMLALKVALARTRRAQTLVFDEVDRGVGGAVADRVGERLARLAGDAQVLVVTHSPQVAARGGHHWRILKRGDGKNVRTMVEPLNDEQRQEEVARMLAGAKVTSEARAAAASLIEAARA